MLGSSFNLKRSRFFNLKNSAIGEKIRKNIVVKIIAEFTFASIAPKAIHKLKMWVRPF